MHLLVLDESGKIDQGRVSGAFHICGVT